MNSFPMILGSGANGAIVHYRAEEGSSSKLNANIPILCDTGAQYLTGTTDTTRTFLFSEPLSNTQSFSSQQAFYSHLKEMYTRVVMGNLDFQETLFPGGPNKLTYGY
jgi:Xaa-Pro aminopeptidase